MNRESTPGASFRLSKLFLARRERDAFYKRVMLYATSVSFVLHVGLIILGPSAWTEPFNTRHIGYRGPLRVLPELSVLEERISEVEQPFLEIKGITSTDILMAYEISVLKDMVETVTDILPTEELGEKLIEFDYDVDLGELLRSSIPQPTSQDVVIKRLVRPKYPPRSVLNEVEGLVQLKLLVSRQGYVMKVWLVDSDVDHLCENSAITAAWQFEFEPYIKNGKPVQMLVSVPIRFRLRDRVLQPG